MPWAHGFKPDECAFMGCTSSYLEVKQQSQQHILLSVIKVWVLQVIRNYKHVIDSPSLVGFVNECDGAADALNSLYGLMAPHTIDVVVATCASRNLQFALNYLGLALPEVPPDVILWIDWLDHFAGSNGVKLGTLIRTIRDHAVSNSAQSCDEPAANAFARNLECLVQRLKSTPLKVRVLQMTTNTNMPLSWFDANWNVFHTACAREQSRTTQQDLWLVKGFLQKWVPAGNGSKESNDELAIVLHHLSKLFLFNVTILLSLVHFTSNQLYLLNLI